MNFPVRLSLPPANEEGILAKKWSSAALWLCCVRLARIGKDCSYGALRERRAFSSGVMAKVKEFRLADFVWSSLPDFTVQNDQKMRFS